MSTVNDGPRSRSPAPLAAAGARILYAGQVLRAIAEEPHEGIERIIDRVDERRERRGERWDYRPDEAWGRRLHELLGAPWPCPEQDVFEELWSSVRDALQARGLAIGRGTFGGWDDADPGLARAAWCLTRHRKPSVVVETGVARGLTTRVVLEAFERNGEGHLWSIDLPPLRERDLASEVGTAVPPELVQRWTLLRGSSRRCLPPLTRGLAGIDLFIHDSMHTGRNVSFELDQVWPSLNAQGVVLVDDVQRNAAFGHFSRDHASAATLICAADDRQALFGCLLAGAKHDPPDE